MGREENGKKSRKKWFWRLVWDFFKKNIICNKKMMWQYISDVDSEVLSTSARLGDPHDQRGLNYCVLITLSVQLKKSWVEGSRWQTEPSTRISQIIPPRFFYLRHNWQQQLAKPRIVHKLTSTQGLFKKFKNIFFEYIKYNSVGS